MLDPDDFDRDPYGHIINQAGHAVFVGMTATLILLPLGWPAWVIPLIVAAVYAGAWEWGIQRYLWRRKFDWRDSLMDTACTMAGASVLCGAFHYITDFWPAWHTVTLCFAAYAALVLWGGLRRWQP